MATKANIEHFETRRAELEAAAAASLAAAQARAAQVTALGSVTIASKLVRKVVYSAQSLLVM